VTGAHTDLGASNPLRSKNKILGHVRLTIAVTVITLLAACYGRPVEEPEPIDVSSYSCRQAPASGAVVRWVETDRDWHIEKLAEWCKTVGPPVVESSGSDAPVVLDSLALITWNAHVGSGEIGRVVGALRTGLFTGGAPVRHFVLFLQEVHRAGAEVPMDGPEKYTTPRTQGMPPSGPRIDIVEAARQMGLSLFYVPSMRNGAPGSGTTEEDRGNAILTTIPMEDFTAIELPLELHRRVAVAATIRGKSTSGETWALRLCSTHLDHRSGWMRFFTSAGVNRLRQAKALASALPEPSVAIGGDLNTWSIARMESGVDYLVDQYPQTIADDTKATVEANYRPDRRVDRMFFRLPGACTGHFRRLDKRFGSDHWPLLGWVTLTCSTDAP